MAENYYFETAVYPNDSIIFCYDAFFHFLVSWNTGCVFELEIFHFDLKSK